MGSIGGTFLHPATFMLYCGKGRVRFSFVGFHRNSFAGKERERSSLGYFPPSYLQGKNGKGLVLV